MNFYTYGGLTSIQMHCWVPLMWKVKVLKMLTLVVGLSCVGFINPYWCCCWCAVTETSFAWPSLPNIVF
jgi:hypothetical protein